MKGTLLVFSTKLLKTCNPAHRDFTLMVVIATFWGGGRSLPLKTPSFGCCHCGCGVFCFVLLATGWEPSPPAACIVCLSLCVCVCGRVCVSWARRGGREKRLLAAQFPKISREQKKRKNPPPLGSLGPS